MKKIYYDIRFLFLSMLMVFSACSDEAIVDDRGDNITPGDGNKTIPIVIKMADLSKASTYGTDYPNVNDTAGSAWEDAINDLTVYIFDNTYTCEKIVTASLSSSAGPVEVTTGNKHFVAVANAAGKMTLPSTAAGTDFSTLQKMLTNASATTPTSPFLMTGKKMNVPLPNELPIGSPYSINMDVERACAKVSVKVMKSNQALSHNITLTKIAMYQGADRVALLETPNPNPTLYTLTDFANVFKHTVTNVSSGDVPNIGTGYCAMVDSFYTYESLCGSDKSKAVKIVLETYVNSVANTRKAEFYLGEYSATPGDTVYNVKRNYWYDVTVNIAKPGMDSIYVTVKSCPWNVADTIQRLEGEGAEIVHPTPLKLVKSYTASEVSSYPEFAAIEKHTKGASWIDLKVTDGTKWNLKVKDGSDRNAGVIASVDGGTTWKNITTTSPLTGTGTDFAQRIYIYRPYRENEEPELGPALYLTLGTIPNDKFKQDLIIQPRDTTPIPTNCYILRPQLSGAPINETRAYIPLAGVYRYWEDYLLDNGDSIPAGNVTAELMWTDTLGTVVKNISVKNAGKRDSAYIYVEAGNIPGNASVAMKVGGKIYWSFHLWVTEYNPYEAAGQKLYSLTKTIFMDRNLGALNNKYDARGLARGLFYQFGRKDPMSRGKNWEGWNNYVWYRPNGSSTIPSTDYTFPTASGVFRPRTATMWLISDCIYNTNYSASMLPSPTDYPFYVENNYLWETEGGNKTAFDPCPEGWRVPKQENIGENNSPWKGLTALNFDNSLSGYEQGRYHSLLGYYPFSSYIDSYSRNSGYPLMQYGEPTSESYFWTSWKGPNARTGTALKITTTAVEPSAVVNKDYGLSVRCVVDLNYLLTVEGGGLFGSSGGSLVEEILP